MACFRSFRDNSAMEERSPYSFLLCDLDVELRDLSLQKGLFQGLFDPDSYMI